MPLGAAKPPETVGLIAELSVDEDGDTPESFSPDGEDPEPLPDGEAEPETTDAEAPALSDGEELDPDVGLMAELSVEEDGETPVAEGEAPELTTAMAVAEALAVAVTGQIVV